MAPPRWICTAIQCSKNCLRANPALPLRDPDQVMSFRRQRVTSKYLYCLNNKRKRNLITLSIVHTLLHLFKKQKKKNFFFRKEILFQRNWFILLWCEFCDCFTNSGFLKQITFIIINKLSSYNKIKSWTADYKRNSDY